ncbi:unnamed protein product [Linum tenue]|uniref:peptide deformylase n=1 Tax=Linum tenue TaxID=586396 RepID=A0AAV0KPM2_9ROSI|nr:unnamed protein product [Linum tenue]
MPAAASGRPAARQLPQREYEEDNKVKIKAALQKMHERPESVKVDVMDINGARFSISLGLSARVFQHEFDHLEVLRNETEE